MKRKINIIIWSVISVGLLFTGCNDDFLNREPTEDLTNNNYWQTPTDLQVYNNGIYDDAGDNSTNVFLVGHSNGGWNSSYISTYGQESQTDNAASLASSHSVYVKVAAGLEDIPSNSTRGGWKWEFLRRCNVFFENYEKAEGDEDLINNYAGEVYFFRAWFYFDKVQHFGDVPLVTKALTEESEELYGERTARSEVMAQVLSDINNAIDLLPESWDLDDRVNKYVAYALKSRICLFEGTYIKYHNLDGDYESWLSEAEKAASEVITSGAYSIYNTGNPESDYRTLFTSADLHDNPEILLARIYASPGLAHRVSGYIASQTYGPTKSFIDDFLCIDKDGVARPVALSTSYSDDTYEDVFKNRDPRLKQTILDPEEESDILDTENGYPNLTGMGGNWQSPTGYHFIKFYEHKDWLRGYGKEINDYPLFRYAEVLLNYAEAKAELGKITQDDLDLSINKLRNRAGMPDLNLNPLMDPKYEDEGLSSLLIEIRRERRIELSFEQFRYQDLMRWKKGSYLAARVLGMRLEDEDRTSGQQFENTTVTTVEVDGKKYVDVYAGTDYSAGTRTFDENKNYLHPIPVNVLAKNSNLEQTPGW